MCDLKNKTKVKIVKEVILWLWDLYEYTWEIVVVFVAYNWPSGKTGHSVGGPRHVYQHALHAYTRNNISMYLNGLLSLIAICSEYAVSVSRAVRVFNLIIAFYIFCLILSFEIFITPWKNLFCLIFVYLFLAAIQSTYSNCIKLN